MSVDFRLTELERRLANLLRLGTIEQLDEATARVKVKSGEMLTGWLPWLTRRAGQDLDWWAPEPGEQVMLLSPSGDPAQGVVLPAIYQTAYPAPAISKSIYRKLFADGTVIEYDRTTHLLKADVQGSVQLTVAETLTADIAGNATLTTPMAIVNGNVQVNGNITLTGNMTAGGEVSDLSGTKTMSNMRATFNNHTHQETGDGGGTTQQPNQQQ